LSPYGNSFPNEAKLDPKGNSCHAHGSSSNQSLSTTCNSYIPYVFINIEFFIFIYLLLLYLLFLYLSQIYKVKIVLLSICRNKVITWNVYAESATITIMAKCKNICNQPVIRQRRRNRFHRSRRSWLRRDSTYKSAPGISILSALQIDNARGATRTPPAEEKTFMRPDDPAWLLTLSALILSKQTKPSLHH